MLVSAGFELKKISNPYQVYIFLRATRGVVTEMHGHARMMIRLSVKLLSSRGNHSWYRSIVKYDLCGYRSANCFTLSGRNFKWIWESVIAHTLVRTSGSLLELCPPVSADNVITHTLVRTSGSLLGLVSYTVSVITFKSLKGSKGILLYYYQLVHVYQ